MNLHMYVYLGATPLNAEPTLDCNVVDQWVLPTTVIRNLYS